jgi:hypothetical protein
MRPGGFLGAIAGPSGGYPMKELAFFVASCESEADEHCSVGNVPGTNVKKPTHCDDDT